MTKTEIDRNHLGDSFVNALNLFREAERMRDKANKVLEPYGLGICAVYESRGSREIQIYEGLPKFAEMMGIETHKEDHSGEKGKKLVCEWKGYTLFQLGDRVTERYEFK